MRAHTGGRADGRYQVHYLPRFAVDKYLEAQYGKPIYGLKFLKLTLSFIGVFLSVKYERASYWFTKQCFFFQNSTNRVPKVYSTTIRGKPLIIVGRGCWAEILNLLFFPCQ